ncbi:MAG: hypothetical protein IKZ35_02135 [Clostridia bacterium]|nr:hypothetical protein [Clostridia bacterium]
MKKISKVALVATILSTLYSVYLISYFVGGVATSSGTEQIGGAIATALVMPHMTVFLLGAVFGWLGCFLKASWSLLVAAILYSVATVLFMVYALFCIPMIVLGFIGYSKQKKINITNQQVANE